MRHALLLFALAGTPALAGDLLQVRLVFDPETAETLAAAGEKVVVRSWFYGDPASKGLPVDEVGIFTAGLEEIVVEPTDQTLGLGTSVPDEMLAKLQRPFVNVNVFTARLTDGNNLLDCGIVDDLLSKIATSENVIECRLLDPGGALGQEFLGDGTAAP